MKAAVLLGLALTALSHPQPARTLPAPTGDATAATSREVPPWEAVDNTYPRGHGDHARSRWVPPVAEALGRAQLALGAWMVHQGVDGVVSDANYACSRVLDGELCVQSNCVWCATDQQCHAAGSFMNPCTNDCCATTSWRSTCFNEQVDDIPHKCYARAHNTSSYDAGLSAAMVRFAAAAYCNASSVMAWDCKPCSAAGFVPYAVLEDDELQLQAFVGVWTAKEGQSFVVISFRGTLAARIIDWVSDLSYKQIQPYAKFPSASVHEGFYHAYYHSFQAQVLEALTHLPDVPILVTGHSLGASIAAICALDLKVFQGKSLPAVYTYGQPRVGDFNFATTYAKRVPNLWRVTHHYDIVPHIPTTQQNFYHSPHEVYYPGDDVTYQICNPSGEDNNCSNSCSRTISCTSVSDHLLYMTVPIGSDQC